jgi:anti-anti-sigma regulatory factor
MLKIERSTNGQVVLTLSGRIETEDVRELEKLLATESNAQGLVLDLKDVTLVNQTAVEFLARCESDCVKLQRCPPYVRKWIEQSRSNRNRCR